MEGDLEEYMSDYALGNAIADVGACFCCLGILGYMVVGRSLAQVAKKDETVVVISAPPVIHSTSTPAAVASIEPEESVEHRAEKEPPVTFWGGLVHDQTAMSSRVGAAVASKRSSAMEQYSGDKSTPM